MTAPFASGNCAGGSADARALDRLRCLVVALRASFVVNLDNIAIQRSNAPEDSGELVSLRSSE
jgi:hypothetical protein